VKKLLPLFLVLFQTPETFAADTIVGTWAQSKAECATAPVTIKPMELKGGDVFCYFNRVKRTGDLVQWHGHCFADGGTRRPETGEDGEDGEVRAFYRNGKLQIAGLGFALPDLKRCK
jgi:hypothetical protein